MDNLFWDKFDKDSNTLRKIYTLENALNEYEINKVTQLIKQIFIDFNKIPATNYYDALRVFDANNGIRLDLNEKLIKHNKTHIHDLNLFFQEITGLSKYCIALKEITKLSDDLEKILQKYVVKHFINYFGVPLGGFEAYLFIGNYGYTPFGIHKDNEESLLLNLGTSSKDVWMWNNKVEAKIKFDVNFLESADVHFLMNAGDFCHIPNNIFHILSSNDFSIMIGVIPHPLRLNLLNKNIFCNERYKEDIVVDELENIIKKNLGDLLDKKFSRKYSEAYVKLLKSNGYFKDSPNVSDINEIDLNKQYTSYGNIIILSKSITALQVACRNVAITLPNTLSIKKMIKALNNNDKISLDSIKKILSKELDDDLVYFVINTLLLNKSIY